MSTFTKVIAFLLIAVGMFQAIDALSAFNNYRSSVSFISTSAVQVTQVAAETQLEILMGIAYLLAAIAVMLFAVASDIKKTSLNVSTSPKDDV